MDEQTRKTTLNIDEEMDRWLRDIRYMDSDLASNRDAIRSALRFYRAHLLGDQTKVEAFHRGRIQEAEAS